MRLLFGLSLLALSTCTQPALAQQDLTKCATVTLSKAKVADLPKLLADIDCFNKAATSASSSAASRIAKAIDLAKQAVTTVPVPPPAPSPPPAPPETVPTPGLPSIASNFDVNAMLVAAWGTGNIPPSAAPDNNGAFRFLCTAGQVSADDPIVYPGEPGRSHLHQFFGNTAANAYSTYESLRKTGDSTCMNIANRSAYWMPAMLNGRGQVVRPDYVSVYYKRMPADDPNCKRQGVACVDLPRGLRFIFGHNMLDPNDKPTGSAYFNCDGPTATPGHYDDLVEAAKNCPIGNRIGAVINAPNCWDGKNLDSPDHRSHVAFGGYGDWGYYRCPTTHPYVIPNFTMGVWYTVDADLATTAAWIAGQSSGWHLSSDDMPGMPMMKPGSTFHADWFGAWDDSIMKMWADNCINRLLNCSGGDLGNGKQLRQTNAEFSLLASPRLVPVPTT